MSDTVTSSAVQLSECRTLPHQCPLGSFVVPDFSWKEVAYENEDIWNLAPQHVLSQVPESLARACERSESTNSALFSAFTPREPLHVVVAINVLENGLENLDNCQALMHLRIVYVYLFLDQYNRQKGDQ